MKRRLWITWILAAVMLLSLTGCITKRQDPPPHPASEDESSAAASSASEESAPSAALAERLCGVYCALQEDAGEESHLMQISTIGGTVLAEHLLLMEGSVYSFWLEELRPADGSVLDDPAADRVAGISQTFSTIYQDGQYQGAGVDLTIALTRDGVTLLSETEEVYTRIEDEGLFHVLPKEQLEGLAQVNAKPDPQPAGVWCYSDDSSAVWVSLNEDGSLLYALKHTATPIFVYTGAWGVDSQGDIAVTAQQLGGGTMPCTWTLGWSTEDGCLYLTHLGGDMVLPLEGEHRFVPASEDWCFSEGMYAVTAVG